VAESCLLNTMGADVPRRESKGSPPIDQEDVVHDRSDQNDSSGMSPKRQPKKRRRAATDQADSSSSPVTCPRVTPLFPGAITALDLSLARCTASGIQRTSTSSSLSDRLQPHQHTIFPQSAGSSCISTGSSRLDRLLSPPPEWDASISLNNTTLFQFSTHSKPIHHEHKHEHEISNGMDSHPRAGHGVAFGHVTEVYGSLATGKTQLALSLAARMALFNTDRVSVYYLAAGGGNASVVPLVRRLSRMVTVLHEQLTTNGQKLGSRDMLERLRGVEFTTVSDGYAALAELSRIESIHRRPTHTQPTEISSNDPLGGCLIVLDSASGCLTPDLLGGGLATPTDNGVGAYLVSEVALTLRRMARLQNHAVLVTNGTAGERSGSVNGTSASLKPALGYGWNAADVQVFFEVREGEKNMRIRATLEQHYARSIHTHRDDSCGRDCADFAIDTVGVVDV